MCLQDCSQLALQTYKSALKADKSNYFVLFYLADLYRTLKQDDLELESLNLLVRVSSGLMQKSIILYHTKLAFFLLAVFQTNAEIT